MARFDALEKKLKEKLADKAEISAMWKKLDFNGNNMCSLAEIDKWVIFTTVRFFVIVFYKFFTFSKIFFYNQ